MNVSGDVSKTAAEQAAGDLNRISISENVLSMQYAYKYRKDGLCRFAVVMDGISGWPVFERGNLLIIDTRLPKSGDYVLSAFQQKTVLCKYFESYDGSYQLWMDDSEAAVIHEKNNDDISIIGVIIELRKYF